jgi:hypothetical protein
MTAADLYELLKQYGDEKILCDLHKPCAVNQGCSQRQVIELIDFDMVSHCYQKCIGSPNIASVDGYTYKGDAYCFVEIKGWKKYLEYNKVVTTETVKKQASRYDLEGKLIKSIGLCERLAEGDIFDGKTVYYILVTDISVEHNPLESLANSLDLLAQTSSDESVCAAALGEILNSVCINKLKIIKQYVQCCDFDGLMGQI